MPINGYSIFLAAALAAAPLFATSARADDSDFFLSPTGNIHCLYDDGDYGDQKQSPWLRCDMVQATQTYTTPPEGCDLDWGTSFYVGDTGRAGLTCHGDTIQNPNGRVLPYGESITFDTIRCKSERSGVTCRNLDGHGFTLSRAKQKLF
ncbi:hypothetical protein HOY34_11575 [Xinfangfangia sp. D13-10-4-6]|uniref:DUF6636 domain-containing protein n=1 Tax=Pseudogemmobacter hezensis TaxID=2737662 RepID=UPI00155577B5|nr:DUF6636 domain-containing protein [Pseudogemmobacter hezensis]NPD15838.1 hypothetical protein [Pseudogemmobacter hezensis]